MNCSQCGYQLKDENYCPQCGTKVMTKEIIQKEIKNELKNVYKHGKIVLTVITGIISCSLIKKAIKMIAKTLMMTSSYESAKGLAFLTIIVLVLPFMDLFIGAFLSLLYATRKEYKAAIKRIKEKEPKYLEIPGIKEIIKKEEQKEKIYSTVTLSFFIFFSIIFITALIPFILFVLLIIVTNLT